MNKYILAFLLVIPLYMTWTFDHSLWNPDETRDAGIASEMFRQGNYAVPKLNGETFLEKPPLYYWACAIIYKITGQVTPGTTRLPSALFGILGILFIFLIGQHLFNDRVALWSAAILATSSQYFRMSHFATMDVTLAALVAGAIYFHIKESRIGFLIFTVLAFYAKGFLGVILPGMVVTIDLLYRKKPLELIKTIAIGAILFTVLVAPWFWALWREGGKRYLEIFLIDNHWKRFAVETGDHTHHPWFFYFMSFPADFLPWTFIFMGVLWAFIKKPRSLMESPSKRIMLIWFAGLLFFFTVSSSKRSIYLLPLFPPAALLCALWLDEKIKTTKSEKIMNIVFASLVGVIIISSFWVVPYLDKEKTFVPFYEKIQENRKDGTLIAYNLSEMERGVFGFYLKEQLQNAKNTQELIQLMNRNQDKKITLFANKNKQEEITPIIQNKLNLTFEYRPGKKSRSYLLYSKNQ